MNQPPVDINGVNQQIQQMYEQIGTRPSKREVKKNNPELLKNALYYYPSWEHAVKGAGLDDNE